MLESILSRKGAKPLAYVLTAIAAAFVFFLMSNHVLAANTLVSQVYSDTNNDGIVDRVRITFDENVIGCNYDASDWSVTNVGSNGISLASVTGVSCTTSDANLDLTVSITGNAKITGGGPNPTISYANAGTLNSIILASGALTAKSNMNIADGAKPLIKTFSYEDSNNNGKIDHILVTFTESVGASSVLKAQDLTLTNVGDFTGAAFGANSTDLITGTVSSVDITLGTEATVKDTHDDSGTIAISSQNTFSLVDVSAATNTNSTLGAQSSNATFVDTASPLIKTFSYEDSNGDGKIDHVLLTFTESIAGTSHVAANDLTLTAVGDFTSAAFGSNSTNLISGTVSSVDVPLGTAASVIDTSEDSGTIAISTQIGFSLDDTASPTQHYVTLGAQSGNATFVDAAKPVIKTFTYQDADTNGQIDRVLCTFSEQVVAASVLRPTDFTFTNVGDFTGAAFGSGVTDSIGSTVTTATIIFGTESTAKDTGEGSGLIAITSQNGFRLDDVTGNSNTTPGAQSVSATFLDGAKPQIKSFNYADLNNDAKIDTIAVNFTEPCVAASVLRPADLLFTNVGDFTGAVFGADTTDGVTSTVTSAAITLGTASTAQDTNDASGTIAISTQGSFRLDDATGNSNTTAGAQAGIATFVDAALPMLLTTSPASGAAGVSRTATIVYTFSEPISTGSFAWTHTNGGPATTSFTAVWSSLNSVVTLTPSGLLTSAYHTVTVTAAPDPTGNAFFGAVAASANPFSFTVLSSSSNSTTTVTPSYTMLVTAPNGGETLTGGATKSVTWSSSETNSTAMNYANIAYTTDSGTTWTTVATNLANNGSYNWTVPSINASQVLLRVTGTDLVNELAYDNSDSEFSIATATADDSTGTTTVTAPSTGTTGISPITGLSEDISVVEYGDYIKSPSYDTVYWVDYATDGSTLIRRPFNDSQTFFTYQTDFSNLMTVTDATLPTMSLGSPMMPKPGVVLVKIQSVAKVYAIGTDGSLRWVPSEEIASALYGSNWSDYVIDIPDTLYPHFMHGDDMSISDYVNQGQMKTRAEVNM